MDNLDVFQQFVAAFPQWKLWALGDNRYQIAYKSIAGYDTYGYNPESPTVERLIAGPCLGFYLTAVTEVNFDGTSLNYKASGYSFRLDGRTGTAAVKG